MGDEIFREPLVEAFDALLKPAKARLRQVAEGERVAELVRQMNEYDDAERRRAQALIAFENGNMAALEETVIGPTPEQMRHATYEKVAVRKEAGTVRSISTMRRVLVPRVMTLWDEGVIDNGQMAACRWYRDCWDATGLCGNVPSTDYSREVFAAPQSRDFFTAFMLDVQDNWRAARAAITSRFLPFFDAVVLQDMGLQRAIKLARKRESEAKAVFRDCSEELLSVYDELKRR